MFDNYNKLQAEEYIFRKKWLESLYYFKQNIPIELKLIVII